MPFLYTHVEYCDIHYVYGYCDGNASAAVNEYRRRYPERRIPSKRVFTRVEHSLRDNGYLPSFALHSEREIVLPLGPHEDLSLRNYGRFKGSTAPSYFCSGRTDKKPASQHSLCYWVTEDTRGILHSAWKSPLRTSTVNQNDQLFNALLKNITLYSTTKNTVMIDSLSVEESLALTLIYLATGRAFEDMKFSTNISPSAISQAVIENCEALMFPRIT